MGVTKKAVLDYLDKRGFTIRHEGTSYNAEYSATGWDIVYGLEFFKSPGVGQIGLMSSSKRVSGEWFWKPNARQLFSPLEVSANQEKTMIVTARQKPIFTERARVNVEGDGLDCWLGKDMYFEIHLFNSYPSTEENNPAEGRGYEMEVTG